METRVQEPSDDPRAEYARRLEIWKAQQAVYDRQHRTLGYTKLALGAVTLVLIGLSLAAKLLSVLWVLVPLVAIIVLAIVHGQLLKKRDRCLRTVRYYEQGLARLDDHWMGTGVTGERFQRAAHPYARDLDVFGVGSLFELLCLARTAVGHETLAQWLLAPAAPDQVRARQAAVADLRHRLDLREDLAVLAEGDSSLRPAEALAAWGEGKPLLASAAPRFVCAALAAAWLASLAAWIILGWGYPAVVISAVNVTLNLAYRRRVEEVVSAVENSARGVRLLSQVMARLEAEPFAAPRLVELRAALDSQGLPPSRWIARLSACWCILIPGATWLWERSTCLYRGRSRARARWRCGASRRGRPSGGGW